MCEPAQKSSCSTAIAGHGFIHVITTQDTQDEMGAILAQIVMIALEGSGACLPLLSNSRLPLRFKGWWG